MLKELIAKRKKARADLAAIHSRLEADKRHKFTADEKKRVDELKEEITDLNETIGTIEETRSLIQEDFDAEQESEDSEDADDAEDDDDEPAQRTKNKNKQKRTGAPNKGGPAKPAAEVRKDVFPSLGHFLQAVAERAKPGLNHERAQQLDKKLDEHQKRVAAKYGKQVEKRGGTGSNEEYGEDGGYLLNADVATSIWDRAIEQSEISQYCDDWNLSSNATSLKIPALVDNSRANGSRMGGVVVYWVNEGETALPSRPKFRYMQVDLNKLLGFWYVTDEMLQDAGLIESIANKAFASEVSFAVDDSVFNGDGVNQLDGVFNSPALISVAAESGQEAGSVVPQNISKIMTRVRPRSWKRGRWFMNNGTVGELPLMTMSVGTGGQLVYMPPGGFSESPYGTLMGRPIEVTEFNQAQGTLGDMAYLDLSEYLLLKKGGLNWDQSMHVQFMYDEHVFRIKLRIGGMPKWDLPLTPAKGSLTTSPYVALAARP